jgi:dTMP kinase|tara:strand:- start:756 stop:2108 length:1353 start_codon:yes stop_codon:yes gene_type:complete
MIIMYLITVEGGDGSGKGLATKVIAQVLEKEFNFPTVEVTGEPRRDHPLGRLAINSVRTKTLTAEGEAGLFAADRVDHSHGWILPRLEEGKIVVSERNIHSSLVYQGIVGGLGIDRVAHMNSAALVPDLCVWVDCDPELALNRIRTGTLRVHSEKEEYFETSTLQKEIRSGYNSLLSGEIEMPTPFDMGAIIGPVLNEGSEEEFRRELRKRIRRFIHSHPNPINVQTEVVEQNLIRKLLVKSKGQTTLVGLGVEPNSGRDGWLSSNKPWKILKKSQLEHDKALSQSKESTRTYIPKTVLAHSISSIVGTLSIMTNADIGELRSAQGPVRAVSESHSHKIIRYLNDDLDWLHQHRSLLGRDTSRNQLKEQFLPFGYLMLAIWPLRGAIQKWIKENPKTHLRYCLGQIVSSGNNSVAINNCLQRIKILGSGGSNIEIPNDSSSLVSWWKGNY